MDNYEFCVSWAQQHGIRVLDCGCGAGRVVQMLREKSIDAVGCDVFYGGNFERTLQGIAESIRPFVRQMNNGLIPFDDASFDVVISNQVIEHVPDLDLSLREIARVLEPGGQLLALFPDHTVWREGHCGIPFLHRFAKDSRIRIYYAAALRALGAGHNKQDFPGVMNWAESFCDWLDDWTYYRSPAEIDAVFLKYFARVDRIEPLWLAARMQWFPVRSVPAAVSRFVACRMAGRVMTAVR